MRLFAGVGLFSGALLLFQVTLTRLFSVAQFYHFAFLVVSLALLGFGASGSVLAVWPRLRSTRWRPLYALGFGPATIISYLILNRWSFDSYAIAWDRTQVWRLLINLFLLAAPFSFAGALIGALLADPQLAAGRIYGANMIGSAAGAALAPLLLATLGDERIIVLSCAVAALAALLLEDSPHRDRWVEAASGVTLTLAVIGIVFPPEALDIQPSPYKSLSLYRLNPDARLEPPRYNAYSRLDIVHSSTIHAAPGLSMAYLGTPPPEIGLLVDGDNLMPVVQAPAAPPEFARWMPASLAFGLYTNPDVLVLGAGGGLDVWIALQNGARAVIAVEPNSLIYDVLHGDLREWSGLDDPRVKLVHQEVRTYVRQTERRFDVVQLTLNDTYRPVTSGAFTLTENYTLTVEAFRAYLDRLKDGGVLVVTRWLQTPPSEELRTLGLIVEALDQRGDDPAQHIVAFRSFQTATFLVKATPFVSGEVDLILAGTGRLKYDMILAPDLPLDTINRYARLSEPVYYDTFMALLNAEDRADFYADYDFDVRPPTDNHPFFFHFFKWRQTPQILNNMGRVWQPFGGSGFFVLVALLGFSVIAAVMFVILPMALRARFRYAIRTTGMSHSVRIGLYFGSLGISYLLIEMATIQQFVLILGQPTLALATVIATLLLFSGIGSTFSIHLPWARMLGILVLLTLVWPWFIHAAAGILLTLPLVVRWPLSLLVLAPLGVLMGVPFARGVAALHSKPDLVPWAWAINGSASVISAVLAVLIALTVGFNGVLWCGGILYGVARLAIISHE